MFFIVNVHAQSINKFFKYPAQHQLNLDTSQQALYNHLDSMGDAILVQLENVYQAADSGFIILDIPFSQVPELQFDVKQAHKEANGDLFWYGELPASTDTTYDIRGSFHFNVYNGMRFGHLRIDSLQFSLYDIGDSLNVLLRHRRDTSEILRCTSINDSITVDTTGISSISPPNDENKQKIEERDFSCNEVDLLVLYTPRAKVRLDSEDLIDQVSMNEVQYFNQALRNSQIDQEELTINFLGTIEIPFEEDIGAEPEDDLVAIINIFSNIRDIEEADVVIVLTDGDYFRQGALNTPVAGVVLSLIPADFIAYGLVEAEFAEPQHTFSHELGHLFGCRHQPPDNNSNTLSDDDANTSAKAHIFRRCFFCQRKSTIMMGGIFPNLFDNTGAEIQHFSNPDVYYYPNRSTGVSGERDNASQLVNTACDISTYRSNDRLLIGMSRSHECVAPGSNMMITTDVLGGGGSTLQYEWRWSFDGVNFSSVLGTGSSFLYSAQSFQHTIFIQVTVTATNGRVETGTIIVNVNQFCPGVQEGNRSRETQEIGNKNAIVQNVAPNPANDRIHISINLLNSRNTVTLSLSDSRGNIVKGIYKGSLEKGIYNFEVNSSRLQEGTYYVTLSTEIEVDGKKLIITH